MGTLLTSAHDFVILSSSEDSFAQPVSLSSTIIVLNWSETYALIVSKHSLVFYSMWYKICYYESHWIRREWVLLVKVDGTCICSFNSIKQVDTYTPAHKRTHHSARTQAASIFFHSMGQSSLNRLFSTERRVFQKLWCTLVFVVTTRFDFSTF